MIKQKKKLIDVVNQINMKLSQSNVVKKNHILLISISGGQDSICVFFMLLQLKKQWKWPFGLIYCNHLWQKDSFYTTSFIVQLASIFQIPLYCPTTSTKIFNEYQSRYWRYDIFYRISFFYNYELVITGHTSSDKVETILFQLIRGTSTQSLTSLHNVKYFFCINKFSKDINEIKIKHLYFDTKSNIIKIQKLFHSNYALKILKKTNIQHNTKFNKHNVVKKTISNKITYNSKFSIKTAKSGQRLRLLHPLLWKSLVLKPSFKTWSEASENLKKKTDVKNSILNIKQQVVIYKNKTLPDKKLNNTLIDFNENQKTLFLIRPILYLTRFDIKKILIFWKLPLYPDKSNIKKHYYRNRIRKQLLPTLRFFFNPQIDTTLVQFTEIITSEQLYLYIVVNRLKNEIQAEKNFILLNLLKRNLKNSDLKNWIKSTFSCSKLVTQLNISLLYGIPLAIQRKIIKKFLEKCTDKQIRFFQIDQIVQIIKIKQSFLYDPKKQSFFNQIFYNFKNRISKRKFKDSENSSPEKQSLYPDLIVKELHVKSIYESFPLNFRSLLLSQIYVNPKSKLFKYKFFAFNISFIPVAWAINSKTRMKTVLLTNFFYRKTCNKVTCKGKSFTRKVTLLPKNPDKQKLNIRKNEYLIGIFENTKNNIFNFKTLVLTNYKAKNISYLYVYDQASNIFLNTFYFQKLRILLYPNVGVIFVCKKKLVFLD